MNIPMMMVGSGMTRLPSRLPFGRGGRDPVKVYDAHCHIFNAGILSGMVSGAPAQRKIGDWWDWIAELFYGMTGSERANHKFIVETLAANFQGATCATVPLMMDLSYATAAVLLPGDAAPLGSSMAGDVSPSTKGLRNQIYALKKLSSKGNCYPFFAVDPRRPGVGEIAAGLVTRAPGGFYGIKLYPRFGFHPMSGCLPALYAYCAKSGIPITTHCSTGGFWDSSHASFCDPEMFRPALVANPSLKINFAHWGNGLDIWKKSILDLMMRFPGVYADLSCYGSPGDLSGFKASLWDKPIVRERTMYGSDYNMVYFTQGGLSLDNYVKSFADNFSQDELVAMISTIPAQFLGFPP